MLTRTEYDVNMISSRYFCPMQMPSHMLPLGDDGSKPKHALLAAALDPEIRRLPAGTPILPVAALMERYQVSQGTVVHALRHLRSKGLVTRPPGKKRLVAVGCPSKGESILNVLLLRPHWSSPDYDAMSYALLEEATRQRLHLEVMHYSATLRDDFAAALMGHDAIVILPSASDMTQLITLVQESHIPAVILWEEPPTPSFMGVADDDVAAGRMATEHLLGLGHEKVIAFTSEPLSSGMQRRLAGWEQALRNAGEEFPERLVIDCSVEPGRDAIVGSYEKLRRWLFQNNNQLPATAIFCLCWTGALGMLRALREVGLEVPRDVSILTHGGENRLCEFSNPALSVVQCSVEESASEALGQLKSACLGDAPSSRAILLPPSIIERESTRRLISSTP